MLNIQERVPTTIQNPNPDEKILFNDATDGKLKTKDSSGVIETLATTEVLAAEALATEPKEYVALLTQTGTNAPVATVLKNTLGSVPVWSYDVVGGYYLTLSNAFTANKTNVEAIKLLWKDTALINDDIYCKIGKVSTSVILLETYFGGANANNILNNDFIEIKVYP